MSDLLSINAVDIYIYQILLIDLLIAVAMISALRFLMGLVANVNSAEELASRDNFAFGFAMAAGIISLALMLTGALSGEPAITYLAEITSVLGYGILGLILIKLGRFIQDKLLFTGIKIQDEIKAGNMSAALIDGANTIAVGLILRAVMLWVETDTLDGIIVVLAAFLLTQALLALVTKYRFVVYARRHDGDSLNSAIAEQRTAIAVRFFGHLIGVALALTAASGVVSYDPDQLILAVGLWLGITLLFTVLVSLLAALARNIILLGVNVVEEVNHQNNIGVAAIEAAIYIAIGLFFASLFA